MSGQLVYEVHFAADFHRGSGLSAPGVVDALLDRGQDGLPRLLGSTIKGQASDGARRALAYLGEPYPDEDRLMRTVFGRRSTDKELVEKRRAKVVASSEEGLFNFLPAILPREGPTANLKPFKHLMTERRFHNLVDDRLGRVKEDFFFSREVGRHNLIFVGRVTWDHDLTDGELPILALGLRMIETVGGKRTRGEGSCLIRLDGAYNGHWDTATGGPHAGMERLQKDGSPLDLHAEINEFVDFF